MLISPVLLPMLNTPCPIPCADSDAWSISYAGTSELEDIGVLLACKAALETYSQKVDAKKARNEPSPSSEMLEVHKKTLNVLKSHLSGSRVQRMARELKLINALVIALRAPLFGSTTEVNTGARAQADKEWLRDQLQRRPELKEAIQLAIRMLTHTVRENHRNEFYFALGKIKLTAPNVQASPGPQEKKGVFSSFLQRKADSALRLIGVANQTEGFLPLMVRLVPLEVGAARFLNGLLTDNRMLLERVVGEQTMSNLVNLIRNEGPRETFMKFFASVCSTAGERVLVNQMESLRQLFLVPRALKEAAERAEAADEQTMLEEQERKGGSLLIDTHAFPAGRAPADSIASQIDPPSPYFKDEKGREPSWELLGHQPKGSKYGDWRLVEGCPTVMVHWEEELVKYRPIPPWNAAADPTLGLEFVEIGNKRWVTLRSLVERAEPISPAKPHDQVPADEKACKEKREKLSLYYQAQIEALAEMCLDSESLCESHPASSNPIPYIRCTCTSSACAPWTTPHSTATVYTIGTALCRVVRRTARAAEAL